MTFSIRRVKEEDAASIVELLNPIIRAGKYTSMSEQLSVQEQLDFMRGFPAQGVFHVAVCHHSQKIVGLQDVIPMSTGSNEGNQVGEISTFVSLTSHRQGVGRGLSQATFQAAKVQGFLKLTATIRADNPQAVSFYLSQGFKPIGAAQNRVMIGGRYIDKVLLEKCIH